MLQKRVQKNPTAVVKGLDEGLFFCGQGME